MVSQTVYFTGMMVFTLTSQMYHRISVLVPVLVRVPEYLSTSTSKSTNTINLKLTSTSKVRVPEIQYSSTASTSTEYEYPSPVWHLGPISISDTTSYHKISWSLDAARFRFRLFQSLWTLTGRADSRFQPSQWETTLLCNNVSHWLGVGLESALLYACGTISWKTALVS